MPFGDLSLDAPEKENKGLENGACNVRSCQAEPANWYNHGSHAWYCEECRSQIQFDPVNFRDWTHNWLPKIGHAMFETREMIDERERNKPVAPPEPSYIVEYSQYKPEPRSETRRQRTVTGHYWVHNPLAIRESYTSEVRQSKRKLRRKKGK